MEVITKYLTTKSPHHVKNEDSVVCDDNFIIIADGMGGEACGDVASGIVTKAISAYLKHNLRMMRTESDFQRLALSAIFRADMEISHYVSAHPEADGMGSTVVLLIRDGRNLYISWCGDSRCYHYSPAEGVRSLTTDHSFVQQLIDDDKISVEESYTHPDNNIITRFVGGGEDTCKPEFTSHTLKDDSLILLCSDGLSGYCRNDDILKEIRSSDIDSLHEGLTGLALRNGSDDDITIVTLASRSFSSSRRHPALGWLKRLLHL